MGSVMTFDRPVLSIDLHECHSQLSIEYPFWFTMLYGNTRQSMQSHPIRLDTR